MCQKNLLYPMLTASSLFSFMQTGLHKKAGETTVCTWRIYTHKAIFQGGPCTTAFFVAHGCSGDDRYFPYMDKLKQTTSINTDSVLHPVYTGQLELCF